MKKKTTIKDIAAKTGLSTATISLVLNNKESRISESTRQLVVKTAKELNYIPDQMAIGLVKKSSRTLGLIISDISNPFFSELAKGVETKASEKGYNIILCDTEDSYEKTVRLIRTLISKNVEGIIMVPAGEIKDEKKKAFFDFWNRNALPVVLVERSDPYMMSDCVITDEEKGGYIAAKHLIDLGHREMGFITGPSHLEASIYRLEGIKKAFEEHNLVYRPEFVTEGSYRFESGYEGARYLLETNSKITAIHAFNDLMAYGVYEYLNEKGIKIPEQVSVLGFDDVFFSRMLTVPLTSVALPIHEMGERAVELLIERTSNHSLPRRHEVVMPKLVIRKSTSNVNRK